jgi:hypothetical protein
MPECPLHACSGVSEGRFEPYAHARWSEVRESWQLDRRRANQISWQPMGRGSRFLDGCHAVARRRSPRR